MTSSEHISRKARGPQQHKDFQVVKIPKTELRKIERGMLEMDFKRYYDMRYDAVYVDPETGEKEELIAVNLPVMVSHGNLQVRSVEHEALMAILGRADRWEPRVVKPGHRICGGCGEERDLERDFQKSKAQKDGLQTWCRDCMSEASKRQYRRGKRKKA